MESAHWRLASETMNQDKLSFFYVVLVGCFVTVRSGLVKEKSISLSVPALESTCIPWLQPFLHLQGACLPSVLSLTHYFLLLWVISVSASFL